MEAEEDGATEEVIERCGDRWRSRDVSGGVRAGGGEREEKDRRKH